MREAELNQAHRGARFANPSGGEFELAALAGRCALPAEAVLRALFHAVAVSAEVIELDGAEQFTEADLAQGLGGVGGMGSGVRKAR